MNSRLQLLDACLTELEEAHERNESVLSIALASRLREHVRALAPGMPIRSAITVVLREQEPYLVSADGDLEPLDEGSAGTLTARIRRAANHLCLLLLEAHERRAPAALGYRSWEDYVRKELGISRRRSYELLDQARVVRASRAAAGVCGVPHISAHAAEAIKPHLDEFTAAIRERAAGRPERERIAVVGQVVEHFRRRAPARLDARRAARLTQAIDVLAAMPPPADYCRLITPDQVRRLQNVGVALRWLSEFARAWEHRDVADLAS
jgi:hypothetical protein